MSCSGRHMFFFRRHTASLAPQRIAMPKTEILIHVCFLIHLSALLEALSTYQSELFDRTVRRCDWDMINQCRLISSGIQVVIDRSLVETWSEAIEFAGAIELIEMILSGEKKPGRKRTQQTTDADEVTAPTKAFQFIPTLFGASKAGGRNIQRCIEGLLELYRLSFPEHLRRAWQCEKCEMHRSGLGGRDEEFARVCLELLWSCEEERQVSADLQVPGGHQEKRQVSALMEKPTRKHGFFKLLSEMPKGWFLQAAVEVPMMNDTV